MLFSRRSDGPLKQKGGDRSAISEWLPYPVAKLGRMWGGFGMRLHRGTPLFLQLEY